MTGRATQCPPAGGESRWQHRMGGGAQAQGVASSPPSFLTPDPACTCHLQSQTPGQRLPEQRPRCCHMVREARGSSGQLPEAETSSWMWKNHPQVRP